MANGNGAVNEEFTTQATGVQAPRKFMEIDASVLEHAETVRIVREDIRMNRVKYRFPSGINQLTLFEECRALAIIDNPRIDYDVRFQAMYDVTMQMLEKKDLGIYLVMDDASEKELCLLHVTNRFQDLSGYNAIANYPCLIEWLIQFLVEEIVKKFPLPGSVQAQNQTAEKPAQGNKVRRGKSSKDQ